MSYTRSSSYYHSTGARRGHEAISTLLKTIGLLLIVGVAIIGGVALGSGESPSEWIAEIRDRNSAPETPQAPAVAQAQPTETAEGQETLAQQQSQPPAPTEMPDGASDSENGASQGEPDEEISGGLGVAS